MRPVDFALRGDVIALDALLKATGAALSGGAAKQLIADSQVRVNGAVATQRGKKLRRGDEVQVGDLRITILGSGPDMVEWRRDKASTKNEVQKRVPLRAMKDREG